MIIRVQSISVLTPYNQYKEHKHSQAKYYTPASATKENIKQDFKILLDTEMSKLKIDTII